MTNAPCYTCPRHSEICHAQCVAYHEWAQKVRKERAAARMVSDADAHTLETVNKILKRRKRGKYR